MRKTLLVIGVSIGLSLSLTGIADAQETTPPTEVNCYPLLSSIVCHIPVTVGPFNLNAPIVEFDSVFPPSPSS